MHVITSATGNATHTPVIPMILVNAHMHASNAISCLIKLMKMLYLILPTDCIYDATIVAKPLKI